MLISFKRTQTGVILRVKMRNSSVSTGAGLTGLTSASTGLIISTIADNEPTSTAYTVAGATIETISTLGTFSTPTAGKCRFKELDATNHKGIYEIQIDNARFAVSSAKSLLVSWSGATNLAEGDALVPLMDFDPYDAVRAGLTTLPNAAAGANGGLPVLSSGATTLAYIVSSVSGSVGSVTGSVGSVTGNVGGNVVGSVASVTAGVTVSTINAGVITSTSIANDAITDAKVAADVTIASVTGAVGSVTGNVGGNVNGNVNGNVAGSTGSVTGSVGSVAGSVGSVAGNVGGSVGGDVQGKVLGGGAGTITGDGVRASSVSGSVGSVSGSVGSVAGSVGSVAGDVGGDVSGKVLGGGSGTLIGDGVRASSVTGNVNGSVIGLEDDLSIIHAFLAADYYIDKSNPAQWELVYVEQGGGATGTDQVELMRKALKDVDGNPIVDTTTVIGQALEV